MTEEQRQTDAAASTTADVPSAPRVLTPAAQRALAEAAERRAAEEARRAAEPPAPREIAGRGGLDPARYGDWENKGVISDF